jgi:hypothetical protein
LPFCGETTRELKMRVQHGKFFLKLQDWENVSEEAKNLVRLLLKTTPCFRPDAKEVLGHSWIVSCQQQLDQQRALEEEEARLREQLRQQQARPVARRQEVGPHSSRITRVRPCSLDAGMFDDNDGQAAINDSQMPRSRRRTFPAVLGDDAVPSPNKSHRVGCFFEGPAQFDDRRSSIAGLVGAPGVMDDCRVPSPNASRCPALFQAEWVHL